ncbi:MAG: dihydropteroate synthase [Campylobacterota bacterium]|nr:dihydropteroate synthase [Campylobacterota bacterium]
MLYRLSNDTDIKNAIKKLGSHQDGLKIMTNKATKHFFYIKNIKTPAANILKQDALAIGAELAVPKGVVVYEKEFVDAILICNQTQLKILAKKEQLQPFGLKQIANELKKYLKITSFKPRVMGILNINEDSFYEKSRVDDSSFVAKAKKMIEDGAGIIDIGGVSSRPGSEAVSQEEELKRVKNAIDLVYTHKLYEQCEFSIDSYAPKVIDYALSHGFGIINDITGLQSDEVCELAFKYNAEVCIMHMKGAPKDMQINPHYDDIMIDVDNFFKERIEKAHSFGIKKIILDSGIGFGKNLEHNLTLIKNQSNFLKYNYPLLVGASRKSMIDKISPSDTRDRLAGSLAIHLKAIDEGVSIIRTHDVFEHVQAIKVHQAIKNI